MAKKNERKLPRRTRAAAAPAHTSIRSDRYLRLFESLSPLIGSLNVEDICCAACEVIGGLLEVEACSILLYHPERDGLALLAASHIPKKEWMTVWLPPDSGICGHTYTSGQSLLLTSRKDFDAFGIEPQARYGRPSCIVTPLIVRDDVQGVINIANPRRSRPFNQQDVSMMEAAARLIAGAIQNAYQFHETTEFHEQLREILDNLHVGVAALDSRMRITHCNYRFGRLLGRSPSRLTGRSIRKVMEEPAFNVCNRLIGQARENAHVTQDRLKTTLGGRERTLAISASPMNAMGSALSDCMLMIEDIGQEEEVQRLREADSIKGAFLRMISHELRTPLTVIQGAMPLLSACAEDDKAAGVATLLSKIEGVLNTNVQKLTGLVNTILDVTEIENGSLKLALQPVELTELLEEKLKMVAEASRLKRIEWKTHFIEGLPTVLADRQRLGQVLFELMDNAVKFSRPGGTARVETDANGKWAIIRIINRGEPIENKLREDVFEKFHQLDGSITRRTGGCGLGLYLARNIARLHMGSIDIVDGCTEDETVFELKLPADGGRPTPAP